MVTTPQEVAVMDVRKAIHLFEQVNVPIVGIVENMSYYKEPSSGEKVYIFGRGGGERLAQQVGAPFLGGIPVDPKVSFCGDEGKSLFCEEPLSAAGEAFSEMAEAFIAHVTLLQRMSQENLSSFELVWKEMP